MLLCKPNNFLLLNLNGVSHKYVFFFNVTLSVELESRNECSVFLIMLFFNEIYEPLNEQLSLY